MCYYASYVVWCGFTQQLEESQSVKPALKAAALRSC